MPFTFAAICRLGHVVSRDLEQEPAPGRCPRCGVTVYSACVTCEARIVGPEYELVQGSFEPLSLVRLWEGEEYEPPKVLPPLPHRAPLGAPDPPPPEPTRLLTRPRVPVHPRPLPRP